PRLRARPEGRPHLAGRQLDQLDGRVDQYAAVRGLLDLGRRHGQGFAVRGDRQRIRGPRLELLQVGPLAQGREVAPQRDVGPPAPTRSPSRGTARLGTSPGCVVVSSSLCAATSQALRLPPTRRAPATSVLPSGENARQETPAPPSRTANSFPEATSNSLIVPP